MSLLPQPFETRMQQLLGDEFNAYKQALSQPPVRGFRVNTAKISLEEFVKINPFGNRPIPYVENGFYLDYDKVGNHPFHHAGMIYVQEPGAMAPAKCVDIDPNWRILDLCAAPGGKSTQLRNYLGPNGVLVSNEIIPSRCKILTGNVERLGLHNIVTTCMDAKKIAKTFPETFDLIMVDAPCSGEGMFRKEAAAIPEWSQENVAMCAARQAEILDHAVNALKDGGTIIYATCTFSLEENEMTVDAFLQRHPEFELQSVTEQVKNATEDGVSFNGCTCKQLYKTRRFYPHKNQGEGQFMAVMRHVGESPYPATAKKKIVKIDPLVTEFLNDTLVSYDPKQITMYNEKPVIFTPDFTVPKGAAFCCGVTIGEVKSRYLQPHHQFFMAMGNLFKRKIDLTPDDPRLTQYLRGEEITTDSPNGWAVVTVMGCTLGGVKVSGGKAKNHYPKGLRLL
ncbi:MAG: methyltransferase domain-containing protein [Clostridia bacterium]|nr:methyltransferase domain-containing protein [Clostridia bacterium]